MKTNYDRAIEIYEAKGQSAVFDAVLDGTLTATSWHWCAPCECESPHEVSTCLVCGTENYRKSNEMTREEKIFVLTQNEIDWFLGNGEELNLVRDVTEFFAKGGFTTYADEKINDQYDKLTA